MNRVLDEYLPPELCRIVFSYSRLDHDLQQQRRALRPITTRIRPYNYYFFRNYYWFMSQIPPGEDYAWVPTPAGGVLIFRL